jgi:glycosyltransferase involved in cell wall biosynthesis
VSDLISIIIPCFNAAPWLRETLDSALAQTHPQLEIIVVDDGSGDESLSIARRYVPRGVRAVPQANAGASAARNHGLRLAKGRYVQYLDADDLISPDKIAAQHQLLTRAGDDCIATCRWGRFIADIATAQFVDDEVFRDMEPMEFLLQHAKFAKMMHPSAWLAPKLLLERAGPWDERLSLNDDGEYFARVVLTAQRIAFCETGASYYRSRNPGSLSQRRTRSALESLFFSTSLTAGHIIRVEDSARVREALADYWQRIAYEIYPDAPDLYKRAVRESRSCGLSNLRPEAGKREQLISKFVGWKLARRLRQWMR